MFVCCNITMLIGKQFLRYSLRVDWTFLIAYRYIQTYNPFKFPAPHKGPAFKHNYNIIECSRDLTLYMNKCTHWMGNKSFQAFGKCPRTKTFIMAMPLLILKDISHAFISITEIAASSAKNTVFLFTTYFYQSSTFRKQSLHRRRADSAHAPFVGRVLRQTWLLILSRSAQISKQ